jgi:hypothetical protein
MKLQEKILQRGIKMISSLAIASLAIILDIRNYIVRIMEDTILEMSKGIRTIRTIQRKETITLSLLYKTSILNAKDATIMII